MFLDRRDAGEKLAVELRKLELHDPIVLALPRGGVPVAAAVAEALDAPLDLVIVRKVGAPGNPELAVAAIVDGNPPDVVLNRDIVEAYGLDEDELAVLVNRERPELERRRAAYREKVQPLPIAGRSVVVVDDGAATGTTMKVAIRALRRRDPARIVAAMPVAPPETAAELALEADSVVCLSQPAHFRALGYYYRNFDQLTDSEVTDTLARARKRRIGGLASFARPKP